MNQDRSAEQVLTMLGADLREVLGADLLGLYVHGSWVAGDFAPARSDLDLLAVLADQPDRSLLDRLDEMHARVENGNPAWTGRVEVEYVALDTMATAAAAPHGADGHTIARISPGEPLRLLPASSHRLLGWATVRAIGRALAGPPPETLLPAIDPDIVRAAALDHVRDWSTWVQEMNNVGGQAYAVLTLCRALHLFTEGCQVSKRSAARYASAALPQWAPLIDWAHDWWYCGGQADESGRLAETTRFVDDLSARILAEDYRRNSVGRGSRGTPPSLR